MGLEKFPLDILHKEGEAFSWQLLLWKELQLAHNYFGHSAVCKCDMSVSVHEIVNWLSFRDPANTFWL